jgi:hypothetical protein
MPPAIRETGEGTAILADGFSCRTQVQQRSGNGARVAAWELQD